MKANERLWLTDDKKHLVAEGDPKAATLYATPGDEIPDDMAKRFGLTDGRLGGKKSAKGSEDKDAGGTADDKGAGDKKSGGLGIFKRGK